MTLQPLFTAALTLNPVHCSSLFPLNFLNPVAANLSLGRSWCASHCRCSFSAVTAAAPTPSSCYYSDSVQLLLLRLCSPGSVTCPTIVALSDLHLPDCCCSLESARAQPLLLSRICHLPRVPGVKPYRKKRLEHYQTLGEIFNTTTAFGHLCFSSSQVPLSSDEDRELEDNFLVMEFMLILRVMIQ